MSQRGAEGKPTFPPSLSLGLPVRLITAPMALRPRLQPLLTSVKCGSLLGLFGRKPSPSTQLRPGPSTLQAQARARSSALASCPHPSDPALPCATMGSGAHLWPPAVGVVTGRRPSKCLPLGTNSTISVCSEVGERQRAPLPIVSSTPGVPWGHLLQSEDGGVSGVSSSCGARGVFSRGTTRISGSLSCGAREVRSPCAWRGGAP